MTYRKKLIEVALPLAAISDASAAEKRNPFLKGHPRQVHVWWARRPLAACRAVIFASLVDDPNDPEAPPEFVEACRKLPRGRNAAENDTPRQRLFDFIETLVLWESTTDEQVLETARRLIRLATNNNPPLLLDPFAGGGSIPLEAQRLGLEAHASDLNPVPVMINKALIEIPPRFANMPPVNPRDWQKMGSSTGWEGAAGLAADLRYYGQWMRDRAWERIGHLYPDCNGETVIAWLWARTARCPNPACRARMPLVRSFDLSRKTGQRAWVVPKADPETQQIAFEVKTGSGKGPHGTVSRQGATCLACGMPVPFDHIRTEGKAGRMGAQLMAIVTEGNRRRNYHAPDENHVKISEQAEPGWRPHGEISHWPGRTNVVEYGMTEFRSLFTTRQLTALSTFCDLVAEAQEAISASALTAGLSGTNVSLRDGGTGAVAYAEAISVYLSLAISNSTNYMSSLCSWNVTNGNIKNTFSRQALPMNWDFAENNPFGPKLSIDAFVEWIARALERVGKQGKLGQAKLQDAMRLDFESPAVVCTDPPYYDNIGYADLADFFYVWLRPTLKGIAPEVFRTLLVPKSAELIASPYRFHGDRSAANKHFEEGLAKAFSETRRIVHPEFPLTMYYAFKQSEFARQEGPGREVASNTGWETMLESLIGSGFRIVGTWPMRTERPTGVKVGENTLASSIVLVCRPRPGDAAMTSRREFVNALRRELPAAMREMQTGNIAPVDLAQASIGPGMAVYTRYSRVLEPNGDRLTVRTALQLINHELDAYLSEQEGYIDRDTRFAVAWFKQFGFKEGPFGQADVLARAKDTAVDGLDYAGVLRSGAGKVQLLHWSELDPGWDPAADKRLTVWEAVHHLVERLNVHGEEGAAMLLAKMPSDLAAQARQLAYRLYSICERKGWAEHARDYNALVISWSASQEQAREFKEQYQQGTLF